MAVGVGTAAERLGECWVSNRQSVEESALVNTADGRSSGPSAPGVYDDAVLRQGRPEATLPA